jgi:hypothetical protein
MSEDEKTQVSPDRLEGVGGGRSAYEDLVFGPSPVEAYDRLVDFTSRMIERVVNALKS